MRREIFIHGFCRDCGQTIALIDTEVHIYLYPNDKNALGNKEPKMVVSGFCPKCKTTFRFTYRLTAIDNPRPR